MFDPCIINLIITDFLVFLDVKKCTAVNCKYDGGITGRALQLKRVILALLTLIIHV